MVTPGVCPRPIPQEICLPNLSLKTCGVVSPTTKLFPSISRRYPAQRQNDFGGYPPCKTPHIFEDCMDNRSIRYSLSEAIAQVKTSACPRVSVVDRVLHGSGASSDWLRVRPGSFGDSGKPDLHGRTWCIGFG